MDFDTAEPQIQAVNSAPRPTLRMEKNTSVNQPDNNINEPHMRNRPAAVDLMSQFVYLRAAFRRQNRHTHTHT